MLMGDGGGLPTWDAGRYATEKWDDRHVIVTFRTFGWQDRVWQHLAEIYPQAPARALFQGVVGIEDVEIGDTICERGNVRGYLLLAPTRPATIQQLSLGVVPPQ